MKEKFDIELGESIQLFAIICYWAFIAFGSALMLWRIFEIFGWIYSWYILYGIIFVLAGGTLIWLGSHLIKLFIRILEKKK
jgi:hypothetical protein